MDTGITSVFYLKMVVGLLVVLGLLGLLSYILKALQKSPKFMRDKNDQPQVMSRLDVGFKQKLLTIGWEGTSYLLLMNSGGGMLIDKKKSSTADLKTKNTDNKKKPESHD